jgi:sugar/nucleoside kinase (ribokinase family)
MAYKNFVSGLRLNKDTIRPHSAPQPLVADLPAIAAGPYNISGASSQVPFPHPVIGVFGQSCRDHYFPWARVVDAGPPAIVDIGGHCWTLPTMAPAERGSKVTVQGNLPPSMLERAEYVRIGGGAYNSAGAIGRFLTQGAPVLFLDTASNGGEWDLPKSLLLSSLHIREMQDNGIFGGRGDKVILRSSLQPGGPLTEDQLIRIARFVEACDVILVNSPKDPEAVEVLLDLAERRGVPVAFVMTPSLKWGFIRSRVLPRVNLAISSWDEIGNVMHSPVEKTIPDVLRAMDTLCLDMQSGGEVLVTLGSQGVVGAGSDLQFHARLVGTVLDKVDSLVSADPIRMNGAGDAFAGGALMGRFAQRSLVPNHSICPLPPLMAAGVAGNALAIQWLGWSDNLDGRDFEIKLLGK